MALPWALLAGLPIADDIIPDRFLSVTWLCLAVLLAVVVDRTHSALRRDPLPGPAGTGGRPRWLAPAAGAGVALVALGPLAAYLVPDLPLVAQPAVVPTWWKEVAPTVDSRSVVLALPAPFTSLQGAMLWQARNPMGYAQVGGGGPGIERPGSEAAGQVVLAQVSFSFTPPVLGATDPTAVRSALEGWGVTTVVVPDQADLPPYDQIPSVPAAVALLTAATGEPPVRRADAWVWTDVRHAPAPLHRSAATFAHCTAGVPAHGPAAGAAVAHCVLAAPPADPT